MTNWRETLLSLTVAFAMAALAVPSLAQADEAARKRADQLNEEGKTFYRDGKLEEAVRKFRQAAVLSPEGRFYFNLCFVLEKQGKLRDALTACEAVSDTNADDRLVDKADAHGLAIRDKLKAADAPTPDPAPGPGPAGPEDPYTNDPPPDEPGDSPQGPPPPEPSTVGYEGNAPPPSTTGNPPSGPGGAPTPFEAQAVETARSRRGDYAWSLGAEFGFAVGNFGRDPFLVPGEDRAFESVGQALRLHTDFMLSRKMRAGVRGYVNILTFDSSLPDANLFDERLQVVDVGAALFQHRQLIPSLYLTYRGGAHIAVQSIGIGEDALTTIGFSAEGTLSYLLGDRRQHVLSVTPLALGLYLPAQDTTATIPAEDYGLDSSAFTWSAAIGYTYRFARVFGGIRVFGLE